MSGMRPKTRPSGLRGHRGETPGTSRGGPNRPWRDGKTRFRHSTNGSWRKCANVTTSNERGSAFGRTRGPGVDGMTIDEARVTFGNTGQLSGPAAPGIISRNRQAGGNPQTDGVRRPHPLCCRSPDSAALLQSYRNANPTFSSTVTVSDWPIRPSLLPSTSICRRRRHWLGTLTWKVLRPGQPDRLMARVAERVSDKRTNSSAPFSRWGDGGWTGQPE
jgi:hypothetical protein